MERVHIYHTNDLHSHLEKWPQIVSFLNKKRSEKTNEKETSFVFDLGDAVDRVHPLMEATEGQAMTRLLNQAHIDGATIGNNEGIGSTKKTLDHLYDEAEFPIILSNLKDAGTGKDPEWATPFKLYTSKEGQKVGVFAVTVPLNMSYIPLGWYVQDPYEAVEQILSVYGSLADTYILLSHVGYEFDCEVARLHPELDLVIGSHTHHLLPKGKRIGKTLIAAAGKFGDYVGEISLEMDKGQVVSSTASVYATNEFPTQHEEESASEQLTQLGRQLLTEKKVAELPRTLDIQWNACGSFVQLALKAVRNYAHTEVALLNAGLFMRPLLAGILTQNDLHETMPHPMRVVRVTLSGEELLSFLKEVKQKRTFLQNKQVEGIGFRGKILGKLCFLGIKENQDSGNWTWLGEEILSKKRYTFATVDHFIFADYFSILQENKGNDILFPLFLRDIVGEYVANQFPL